MKKTVLAAALASAALCISGCTGDPVVAQKPADLPVKASAPTSSNPAPTYDGKAWADSEFDVWFRSIRDEHMARPGYSGGCYPMDNIYDLRDCMEDRPSAYVVGFESPAPGKLTVMVAPGAWQGSPYDSPSISGLQVVAQNVAPRLESAGAPADSVTVVLVGGSESGAPAEATYNPS